MIKMNKFYKTRNGLKVKIISTNLKNDFPVVAILIDRDGSEIIRQYTETGKYYDESIHHNFDLVEYNPAKDLKVDDRILVKDKSCIVWYPRHFSHIGKNGKVYTFDGGCTSFTAVNTTAWEEWKYPE